MELASDIGLDMGVLKKGPWTSAEDSILISYVTKHGEGNWNSVQKHSGLFRCGKSCRLRWANHLRPNLKKGAFTPDEERIIVELHAKLGNKWARMAAQLPGRTDNEIKNYWNTRIKRRSRAGLPVYPADKSRISSTQYYVERSGGRSFISGKEIGYDLTSSFSSPGDHLENMLKANERDSCLVGTWTSMRTLPSSGDNEGPSQLFNKTMGNQNEQPNVLKPSDQGRSAESNESFSLDQLPEGKIVNFLSDSNASVKACNHDTMTRPVFTGLANETERNMLLYDRLSAYGHLNMLFNSSLSDASLRLELPSSQSAESANSAGTQRSSITNPSPIITANHILSEVESYGSNSSNFLEVLMQEAHPAEGLEQVRLSMDLIEQLMIFRSGNVPPDVAALLLSPQKRRWDEDSDPITPLGGRTFSDHSEEISPLCQTANWDEPRGSTIYSLPPASQLLIPRVEANPTELLRGGTQQACTDEDFLNLLDMGNSDSVSDWYIPSDYHALGVVPCASPVDSMEGLSNPQNVAGLDNSNSNINVIWNFGASGSSCTWNPAFT